MLAAWLDDIKANQSRWILSSLSIEVHNKSCAHRANTEQQEQEEVEEKNSWHCIVKIWVNALVCDCVFVIDSPCWLRCVVLLFYNRFCSTHKKKREFHFVQRWVDKPFLCASSFKLKANELFKETSLDYGYVIGCLMFSPKVFIYSSFHLVFPSYPFSNKQAIICFSFQGYCCA